MSLNPFMYSTNFYEILTTCIRCCVSAEDTNHMEGGHGVLYIIYDIVGILIKY